MIFTKKNLLILTLLLSVTFYMAPQYEAEGSVTAAVLLAPVAIQAAKIAAPYVIRGLANMGKHMLVAGKELLYVFLIPVGLIECTVLAPWGLWRPGLKHLGMGGLGILKFCGYMLLLPISPLGINVGGGR